MIIHNLPFSRKFLDNFRFHINEGTVSDGGLIITFDGYRYGMEENDNYLNAKALLFGYYNEKPCYVSEEVRKITHGFHLMGSDGSEAGRCLAGIAKATLNWHKENIFCGVCGKILYFMKKETGKICRDCGAKFYPRVNPAVIVLVKKGDEFLLTRKREWQKDRFGLVAGFVEYGESAEETVEREVFEETGLKIENLKYVLSQFWPFPYQLMLGYFADYKSGEILVDERELEQAKWFNKKNLPLLPPKSSISRLLIDVSL